MSWSPSSSSIRVCLLAFALASLGTAQTKAAPGVDFSRQVLPILSDNCFACHGPDENERKAKLRLDIEEGAWKTDATGAAAVVPGKPEESLLVQRILTTDQDDVMPPPKTGKKLTPAQAEILTQWIASGGKYEKHWAFVPPERPELPDLRNRKWPRNAIDHFTLARLEQERIKPAPEADKTTLARRATLTLTGLPPTPKEIDAFLADKSPEAYERLVDRLLEKPQYGEHMARYWMDAARYADSHGYHIDAERHMWKWRDWVVDAFNRNLPYDEFTRDQLAGDLRPATKTEAKVASGYIRANMSTGEGGAIEEEYLAKYTFDRTETTGTIWLGLTLTCARCHTHKYDPITHREYYGLFSFFNNLDEPVMDENKPNPDPILRLPTDAQSQRLNELNTLIADGQTELDAPLPELDLDQGTWSVQWRERLSKDLHPLERSPDCCEDSTDPTTNAELQTLRLPTPSGPLGGLLLTAGRPADPAAGFRIVRIEAAYQPPGATNETPLELAKASASSWEGDHEPGRVLDDNAETGWIPSSKQTSSGLFLALKSPVDIPEGASLSLRLRYAPGTAANQRPPLSVSAANGADLLGHLFPPKPAPWKVLGPFKAANPAMGLETKFEPEEKLDFSRTFPGVREEIRWQDRGDLTDGNEHLFVNELHGVHGVYYLHRVIHLAQEQTLEFSLRADDVFKFWIDDVLVAAREAREKPGEGPVQVSRTLSPGEHRLFVKVANLQGACRFSFNLNRNVTDSLSSEVAALLLTGDALEGKSAAEIRNFYRRTHSPHWKKKEERVALWREERHDIDRAVVTTMIAKERQQRRETHMLMRGDYDKPGELVRPGVPAILPPWPEGAPTNRLGLAEWLLDPHHPLTARVTVNRFWQQHFGVGLVKTTEDFGVQGERPSHPELLDWLATEFVKSGWNVKQLHRLMVTSATFRQSSRWRKELAERDPENRLLARGPRFRVDGEVVRDTALAVSGLLVETVGGKSVKPYEPAGLWEAVSFNNSQKYVQDIGEGNYRRSLYTHWKRQSPPPNMLIFDAPTREYCVVRRPRTNTPLQALALLNDPQFVEACRAFAQRILTEGGSTMESRLRYGFRLATAREPRKDELRILRGVLESQLAEFRADTEAARLLLAVGAFEPRNDLNREELAAWSTLASLILNLDETITQG